MALTTRTNDYELQLLREIRHAGATHLHWLRYEFDVSSFRTRWRWRTERGNYGDFETEEPLPTTEEMTAMFAAIKLTD